MRTRVSAVREQSRANAALAALVATCLDLPKSIPALTKGGKSELKILNIAGDPAALAAILRARMAEFD